MNFEECVWGLLNRTEVQREKKTLLPKGGVSVSKFTEASHTSPNGID